MLWNGHPLLQRCPAGRHHSEDVHHWLLPDGSMHYDLTLQPYMQLRPGYQRSAGLSGREGDRARGVSNQPDAAAPTATVAICATMKT